MLLIAPNGAAIEACDDQVQKLIDAGFTKTKSSEEPKPRRVLRKTKPKDKEQ